MANHFLKNELCALVVVAELGTAVGVREGKNAVEAVRAVLRLKGFRNKLCLRVYTADRGDYPQLVADTDLAVGAGIYLDDAVGDLA